MVVPLLSVKLIPHGLTPENSVDGIRSLYGFGSLVGPLAQTVLYPRDFRISRLVQKLFRGEPAITEFDWPFTPNHVSSEDFSTFTGSDLHPLLHGLHPGHG